MSRRRNREDVIIHFGGDARGANQTMRGIQGGVNNLASSIRGTLGGAGGLLSLGAFVKLSRDVAQAAEEAEILRRQIQRLSGSPDGMGKVVELADNLGVEMRDAVRALNIFSPAFEKSGRSFSENVRFVENLTKALRVYGVEGISAKSVTIQLAQALGSGNLAGDELRSLRENAGKLALELERAVQSSLKTNASIKELGSAGALTSDVILAAFGEVFSKIQGNMESLPDTITHQEARLKNAWRNLLASMDTSFRATDFWKWFTGFGASLSDRIAIALGGAAGAATESIETARDEAEAMVEAYEELERSSGRLTKPGQHVLDLWRKKLKALNDELASRSKELGITDGSGTESSVTAPRGGQGASLATDKTKKENREQETDLRRSIAARSEILAQYHREFAALQEGNTEAAQKAQKAQEEALKNLLAAGEPASRTKYFEDLVKTVTELPAAQMKVTIHPGSLREMPLQIQEALATGPYEIQFVAKVTPELVWDESLERAVDQQGGDE